MWEVLLVGSPAFGVTGLREEVAVGTMVERRRHDVGYGLDEESSEVFGVGGYHDATAWVFTYETGREEGHYGGIVDSNIISYKATIS
uniref:Uncharacterized protein n=1 Tax=viral metagenome TaxID=1070528 RepID=A0A6M3INJ2_9ZZZZ